MTGSDLDLRTLGEFGDTRERAPERCPTAEDHAGANLTRQWRVATMAWAMQQFAGGGSFANYLAKSDRWDLDKRDGGAEREHASSFGCRTDRCRTVSELGSKAGERLTLASAALQ